MKPVLPEPEVFTKGKTPELNEDAYGYNDHTWVVCDGVSDKSGELYNGKRGGELTAPLVVDTVLGSDKFGIELVARITARIQDLYRDVNPRALVDHNYQFGSTMIAARRQGDEIIVTQVGDSPFRVNGRDEYTQPMEIDRVNAGRRKEYIEATGDVEGARAHILPYLKDQLQYANNPDHKYGYGVLNGFDVPEKYVKVYRFRADKVHTIELVTDGYADFPKEVSIDAYEKLHREILEDDPTRTKKYVWTKVADDRTVLIGRLAEPA